MKEEYIDIANETFQDYSIKITINGWNENKEEFVIVKVRK